MGLRDKLHALADADPNADLLEFFGVGPGEFHWDGEKVTVGAESVPLAEARATVLGGQAGPRRTVKIEDL